MIWRQLSFVQRQMSDIAELALASTSPVELWPQLLAQLERVVGFEAGYVATTTGTTDRAQGAVLGHNAERLRENIGRYLCQITPAEVARYTDRTRRCDEVWSKNRQQRLAVFQELLVPAGTRQMIVRVSMRNGVLLGFNLERRSAHQPFRDRELALLDAVAPLVQVADAFTRGGGSDGIATKRWADEHGLSKREAEVAQLATRGLQNAEIAGLLGVSAFTVRNTLSRVFAKAEVSTRSELAFLASQGFPSRLSPSAATDGLPIFYQHVEQATRTPPPPAAQPATRPVVILERSV